MRGSSSLCSTRSRPNCAEVRGLVEASSAWAGEAAARRPPDAAASPRERPPTLLRRTRRFGGYELTLSPGGSDAGSLTEAVLSPTLVSGPWRQRTTSPARVATPLWPPPH